MTDSYGFSATELRMPKAIIVMPILFAAMLSIILIGQVQAQSEQFCCDCPLKYTNAGTTVDDWFRLRDQYCDAYGNLKSTSTTGDSATRQAKTVKSMPYPRQELLTPVDSNLGKFVILDTREPGKYGSGHIAGARNLYWRDLQTDGSLDPARAESALRKLGIENSDSLLIYGEKRDDVSSVFWALSYLGHRDLSLLEGNLDSAQAAGVQMDRDIPIVKDSNYTIKIVPWLLVSANTLAGWLNQSNVHILDARDWVDYGRSKLTNAYPLDVELLYKDGKLSDAATLRDLFSRHGLDKNGTQLVYGTPQAYSLFYSLKLMGYNATLLEGDWWQETELVVSEIK
ncbi:Rhodanese-like domain protein [uncultured archaeon]|nr:Rhodanese-like domain protein [uncultured archaeon]